MSQENVELARASLDAWTAHDLDGLRATYAEDVVSWPPVGWPEEGPFVGRDMVVGQWERMRQLWDDDQIEMHTDYIDAADRVAVRMVWRERGDGSAAESEATGIFTIRDGRIRVAEFFWDHTEALAILELPQRFSAT